MTVLTDTPPGTSSWFCSAGSACRAYSSFSGNPLATCAPYRRAYELDPGTGQVLWEVEARCRDGIPGYVPRFVPLDW